MRLTTYVSFCLLGCVIAKRPFDDSDLTVEAHVLMQTKSTVEKASVVHQDPLMKAPQRSVADGKSGAGVKLAVLAAEVLLGVFFARTLARWRDERGNAKEGLQTVSMDALELAAGEVASAASATPAALFAAARAGDESEVAKVLAAGCSADARDAWSCTALHVAADVGSVVVARRLLENGASVDAREAWDETPLHFAARTGSVKLINLLLGSGASIDAINADDKTPLVMAAAAGHEAACRVLLDRGGGAGDLPDDEVPPLLAVMIARDSLQVALGLRGPRDGEEK